MDVALLLTMVLVVFIVLHVCVWHFELSKNRGVGKIITLSVVAFVIGGLIHSFLNGIPSIGTLITVLSVYLMLIMLYLHWYVGIDRSVSVRVLGELANTASGQMTFKELEVIYPQEHMFKHRLDLMVTNGWLIEDKGQYQCAPKSQKLAQGALFLKNLYNLSQTG